MYFHSLETDYQRLLYVPDGFQMPYCEFTDDKRFLQDSSGFLICC